jgi:hypothetical protein
MLLNTDSVFHNIFRRAWIEKHGELNAYDVVMFAIRPLWRWCANAGHVWHRLQCHFELERPERGPQTPRTTTN